MEEKITKEQFGEMVTRLEESVIEMKKNADTERVASGTEPTIPANVMFIMFDEVTKMLNKVKDNYECK